jgi:DNA-binding NarL/FixJ family response regulator
MFIRQRSLIDTLILMYDYLWTLACPIFTTAIDDGTPTGRPAQVLELMSLGFKDESIARSLGLGVRSIRRDIVLLKTQLNVSTRAEVVAAAVRKGWL